MIGRDKKNGLEKSQAHPFLRYFLFNGYFKSHHTKITTDGIT